MAHFALVNKDNIVEDIVVVRNEDCLKIQNEKNFLTEEESGIFYLNSLFGDKGEEFKWIQASYNQNFRDYFPGIGFNYCSINDVFYPPISYTSWSWDSEFKMWRPPVDFPYFDHRIVDYEWDEETQVWNQIRNTEICVYSYPKHFELWKHYHGEFLPILEGQMSMEEMIEKIESGETIEELNSRVKVI